ncbi:MULTISPECIES: ABC transporter permease [Actinomadura]|uniref:Transport permease protein n=1 Tax=Actinomadura litoris TaxID=2678616 RepID=A0A7K1LD53_9ACTN|nr:MULTISPECIES: ABC transporter permease [Actinomadura]MBT2214079.1 ABC transporter permease [Actinomadura sp. NEAU-AAG7]MUN42176.1 ABC transporter permease subunit [Actinomadura litoris]
MTALIAGTWWMTHRRLSALVRNPAMLIMSLAQPVIWLFLFGQLFKRVVELPGFGAGSYLDYLVPGVVIMNAVSLNSFAGMATLDEIERGTLNRFLVTPVRRSALANAGVIEQALSTAFQSLVIIALGWAGGAHYPGAAAGLPILVAASVLIGVVLAELSTTLALLVRDRNTIIMLNVMLLLPLTFLSSAFMAKGLMPGWMRHVASGNPVSWALDAGRAALADDPDWGAVAGHAAPLLALAAATVGLAVFSFRSYQRSQ